VQLDSDRLLAGCQNSNDGSLGWPLLLRRSCAIAPTRLVLHS